MIAAHIVWGTVTGVVADMLELRRGNNSFLCKKKGQPGELP